MNTLAIITARGGSKRIPGKNIRPFLGRPILAYSVEAALASGIFDEVMVSTDDEQIAAVARAAGAAVPFMRSAATADDHSTTAAVLAEVLAAYRMQQNRHFEVGCCIYPTAPFVTPTRLAGAHRLLLDSGADTVLPIVRYSFPIQRSFSMGIGARLAYNWPEHETTRSQDLPGTYHDSGQFYFFKTSLLYSKSPSMMGGDVRGVEVSEMEVQDIDNETDWQLAEMKYRLLMENQRRQQKTA